MNETSELSQSPEVAKERAAVIVLGQSTRTVQGLESGFVSKMSVAAGASVAKSLGGNVDLFIISRDADELEKFLKRTSKSNEEIIADTRSGSTGKQARTLAELFKGRNYAETVLVVPSIHFKRASNVLKAWGVNINETVSAEEKYLNDPDISITDKQNRQSQVQKWHASKTYRSEKIKEAFLGLEQLIDKKQQIPLIVASFTRKKKA